MTTFATVATIAKVKNYIFCFKQLAVIAVHKILEFSNDLSIYYEYLYERDSA